MDPLELTGWKPGAGDPKQFLAPSADNKLKVTEFDTIKGYKKFIQEHPYIDIVSSFNQYDIIVVTYRGKL